MSGFQNIIMCGKLGHDLELTISGNGVPYTNFTLYLNNKGTSTKIPCVAFNDEARKLYDEKTKGATLTLQLEVINHFNNTGEPVNKFKVIKYIS